MCLEVQSGGQITRVLVAIPYRIRHDYRVESSFNYNPSLRRDGDPFDTVELPLSIEEVAERLGIGEEAARAIVAASLQVARVSLKNPLPFQVSENFTSRKVGE
jgi:hypothetical protein